MNKSCQVIIENIVSFYPIPIPLMEIAEDEGIRVIFDDYGTNTFDGMTWYEAEQEMFICISILQETMARIIPKGVSLLHMNLVTIL